MTKIISELGINHNGSLSHCKKMILDSKNAGCWGVKFQYRNLKRYFSCSESSSEIGAEIVKNEIKRNYLDPIKIKKIAKYAKKLRLKTGISFFDCKDIDDFKNFSFDFYKVPSAEALDIDLIKKLFNKNKLLFISFGGLTEKDIIFLKKKIINKLDAKRLCILHCVSNYPLSPINSNLGYINRLKKIFPKNKIGYSSHENDIVNCIISLSKKISYIERHYTIDKNSLGLDHTSSSDFKEMKKLCFYANNYDLISKKNKPRYLNQGEKINIQNLGKSAITTKNYKKGNFIKLNKVVFNSPRIGLTKNELYKFLKKKLIINLPKNSPIKKEHFIKNVKLDLKSKYFLNNKKISLPIRPHDYQNIKDIFGAKNYEFHLSFNDVNNFTFNKLDKNFLQKNNFSVHGPDYCNEYKVLDIFSKNINVRRISNNLINKSIQICKKLKKISKKESYLIQSFSSDDENIDKFKYYLKLKNFVNKIYNYHKIKILPQWLPPFAWYFGGSVKMSLFTDPKDLKFLKKINLKICMDLSHFIMSCNYFQHNLSNLLKTYFSLFGHFHLADASGIDNEGLSLGEGDFMKNNIKILRKILNSNKIKVLEAWQGHLNNGDIFKNEIKKLTKIK